MLNILDYVLPLNIQLEETTVQRAGTVPKIQHYDLKQHSAGVLGIMLDLITILELPGLSTQETNLILHHDVLETFTGDLPWTIKNASIQTQDAWAKIEETILKIQEKEAPILKQYMDEFLMKKLSRTHFVLFKFADMFDLYLFCIRERQLGNTSQRMAEMWINARAITLRRVSEIAKELSPRWGEEAVIKMISAYMKSSGYEELQVIEEDL